MNPLKLSKNQVSMLYAELLQISKTSGHNEAGREDEASDIRNRFSLSCADGKQLYKHLSDKQLLQVIKERAAELEHSPSQKEVFWVWREYIKLRFKKWPYALTAAGLPKNAGEGGRTLLQAEEAKSGRAQIITMLREKAKRLGRLPHPCDLPEMSAELSKYRYTWKEMIQAAHLDQDFFIKNSLYKIMDLEEEYRQYLQKIYLRAYILGRAPLRNEIEPKIKKKVVARCGTWRNTLYQIGLEPVVRIQPFSSACNNKRRSAIRLHHQNSLYDCYYRILNPDIQAEKDLRYIRSLAEKEKHLPTKNEVPADIRKRLQKSCGSWANALYQIQYIKETIAEAN